MYMAFVSKTQAETLVFWVLWEIYGILLNTIFCRSQYGDVVTDFLISFGISILLEGAYMTRRDQQEESKYQSLFFIIFIIGIDIVLYWFRLTLIYGFIVLGSNEVQAEGSCLLGGQVLFIVSLGTSPILTFLVYISDMRKLRAQIKKKREDFEQDDKKGIAEIQENLIEKRARKLTGKDLFSEQSEGQITENGVPTKKSSSLISFFQYATNQQILFMILGTLSSVVNGLIGPYFSYSFGNMTNDIAEHLPPFTQSPDLLPVASKYAILYLILGGITFLLSFISLNCWMIAGERQALKFRTQYFALLLSQDIRWFDETNPAELSTQVTTDLSAIQGVLGERVSTFCYIVSLSIGSFVVAFLKGSELASILTGIILFSLVAVGIFYIKFMGRIKTDNTKAYEIAGGYAEQALSSIRTVKSLNGEQKELFSYSKSLQVATSISQKIGLIVGISLGFIFLVMIGTFAYGFYYGSQLVKDGDMDSGDLITIVYSLTLGTMMIAQLSPILKSFGAGKEGLDRFMTIKETPSYTKINSGKGEVQHLKGEIKFEKINFSYPTNSTRRILEGTDIVFEAQKKTALIGGSGSGKSTCLQLILRLYEPNGGAIKIDGIDIKRFDLSNLRRNIGYVGQEPTLFSGTVSENLRFGKADATDEEIIQATKSAKAYDFIMNMEKKFDTIIGPGGASLSGGQKQRLAIARVLLKDPKILLLDEATSALDRKSEKEIQEALDELSVGRTTIVVAHRLATIQNSDKIIVMDKGKVIDSGTHHELREKNLDYKKATDEIQEQKSEDNDDFQPNDYYRTSRISTIQGVSSVIPPAQNRYPESINLGTREIITRLLKISPTSSLTLIYCLIASVVTGGVFPIFGYMFSRMLTVLSNPEAEDFIDQSNHYSYGFGMIAVIMLFSLGSQIAISIYIGEALTHELRTKIYERLLNMDVAWFDKPCNLPGSLTSKLSNDALLVNGLITNIFSILTQSAASLIIGMSLAFWSTWKLTAWTTLSIPLVLLGGYWFQEVMNGFTKQNDSIYKESSKFLTEMVTNMKTVASFSNEEILIRKYDELFDSLRARISRRGWKGAVAFAFAQLSTYVVYAFVFYLGIYYLNEQEIESEDMYCAIFAIVIASFSCGAATQFMPEIGNAKKAASNLFTILETKNYTFPGNLSLSKQFNGKIEFKDICFKYPSQENDTLILKKVSLTIEAGKKYAFVGPSGCGKSTLFQLLLRYYDDYDGSILIEGRDIREYKAQEIREAFGIVSQEPTLFNTSILENIKYATPNAFREQVIEAAKSANAHGFIGDYSKINDLIDLLAEEEEKRDKKGFELVVGIRGGKLSGGQKQRVAIARTIIRHPNVYLFDEATSALDNENETIVQASLDNLSSDKTSITIAHRYATIMNADKIFVFVKGRIVENGTYPELIEKKGIFYNLVHGYPVS